MIYTSYFGNLKNCVNPISIARFTPKGINIPCYFDLAPSEYLLKQYKSNNDIKKYCVIYVAQLKKLNPFQVYSDLRTIYGQDDFTLMCYEKTGFCHRQIVAKWFIKNGINVQELQIEKPQKVNTADFSDDFW